MKLVNLTRDVLHVYDVNGDVVELPADPRYIGLASVGDHRTIEDERGNRFSMNVRRVTEIKGLPEPNGETVYVVPVEIAMAVQATRDDVFYPADEAQIRGADGRLLRITHLSRIVPGP